MESALVCAKIESLAINNCYQREIFGLGEVYEIMSVEKTRKQLLKKFHQGTLHLASNKSHSDRGLTLSELRSCLENQGLTILCEGYTDSPPWLSRPLTGESKKKYHPIIIGLAKIIFRLLLPLEFFWNGSKKSHMIFCFSGKT